MGRIPSFLLRHRITIEPYAGVWGVYGPPVPGVRCAIAEKLSGGRTQAGTGRYVTVTIVTQLSVHCPEGSLITLPDGRKGFAQAVAKHTSGGLPTPDHTEIGLAVPAPSYGAPLGGELVVILHRIPDGTDRYNNTRYRTESVEVGGAAVRVLSSDERAESGGSTITDSIEVMLPPGTEVTALDRLQVRGLTYEVDGRPKAERDPMTGAEGGVRVIAHRVAG